MKELKQRMSQIRLSDRAKSRILESVQQQMKTRSRLRRTGQIGLLSAAAACLVLVSGAAVLSAVSLHTPNTVIVPTGPTASHPSEIIPEGTPPSLPAHLPAGNESSDTSTSELSFSQMEPTSSAGGSSSDIESSRPSSETELLPSVSEPTVDSPSVPETNHPEDDSRPSVSTDTPINIIMPDEMPTEEFAADMYRPDGYPERIGSVLALKLSLSDNPLQTYPVILYVRRAIKDHVLAQISENEETLSAVRFSPISINGERNDQYRFATLTADQILMLAQTGATLSYVGSGSGDPKNINWDTAEGIETFCERMGDMYIFQGEDIRYYPDILDRQPESR